MRLSRLSAAAEKVLIRALVALVVLQNFVFAVPMTEAAQAGAVVTPMVATGSQHTLALKSDGTVWSWGQNDSGQIGNNTNSPNIFTPIQVHGVGNVGFLTGVMAIAAAGSHSLALKSDGTVFAWGSNATGELGDGTTTERDVPVAVSGLTGIKAIAAGGQHSLALKSDGTVWAWGDNTYGQIGDNSNTERDTPVQVDTVTGVTAIAGSSLSSFALLSDGNVWAWGNNTFGALGDTTTTDRDQPVQVASLSGVKAIGGSRAVKTDGTAWAWGGNLEGQLGINSFDFSNHATPVQVHGVGNVGFLTNVTAIVSGGSTTFALKADGTMFSWGFNTNGELGDGSNTDRSTPVQTSGLSSVMAISNQTALKSDGTVWKWGDNENGFIGDGTNTDSNVPTQSSISLYVGPSGVIAIAGGVFHSLALKSNGTVWAWGQNTSGELGDGTNADSNAPVQVSGLTGAKAISGGYQFSAALKSNGTVWTWGDNVYGQLGNGNTGTDSNVPVQVSGLTNVVAMGVGDDYGLALKSDGTVWSWGYNFYGELGNSSNTDSNVPVQVTGLTGVVSIFAAGEHGMALLDDGTVWDWGYNTYGQLGNGANANLNAPVQVTGLTNVAAIAGGDVHSLALIDDGTVWAWGRNGEGQLGDSSNTTSNLPVQVTGLTTVAVIGSGLYQSIALLDDGTVWDWGEGDFGELGNAASVNSNFPVQVSDGDLNSDVTAVGGGFYHSMARKSDGNVWTWGDNTYGQLGDGSNATSNVPVMVLFPSPPGPTPNTVDNTVTLSRIAINATATATVHFVLNDTLSSQLTVTFDPAFTNMNVDSAVAVTPDAVDCMDNFVATGENTFTADKASCTGEVTITGITITNPGTPGGYLVSWVNDDDGYAMVAIVDSDQINVNAQVAPSITFDLDTATSDADTNAPYSVALGALSTVSATFSDGSTVNSIWADLDTNASGGAVVSVLNANGADGLASASAPGDFIPNAAASVDAGTANYGICVKAVSEGSEGPLAIGTSYTGDTCAYAAGNDVEALSDSIPDEILNTSDATVIAGRAEILVNAAIDDTTVSHTDYTDTLTFVATGTF